MEQETVNMEGEDTILKARGRMIRVFYLELSLSSNQWQQ